jgi:hypothetical protein
MARIVRHVRERFDGAGHPDGLAGEQIAIGRLVPRMRPVARDDVRPPASPGMDHGAAVAEPARAAGTHVVAALPRRMAANPAGAARLSAPPAS